MIPTKYRLQVPGIPIHALSVLLHQFGMICIDGSWKNNNVIRAWIERIFLPPVGYVFIQTGLTSDPQALFQGAQPLKRTIAFRGGAA